MSSTTENILKLMEVPNYNNVFILGSFEKRVTIHSQQIRAFNLIYSLVKENRLKNESKVVIIGAGISGITAASSALSKGANVTILEKMDSPMKIQANSSRWIHPNIYDWPKEISNNNKTDLPFLNWEASLSKDLVSNLFEEWNEIESIFNKKNKIEFLKNIQNIRIGNNNQIFYGSKNRCINYDILILSVGFGLEYKLSDFIQESKRESYWIEDGREAFNYNNDKLHYLVSGIGDGGLIDSFRLRFNNFQHDKIMEKLLDFKCINNIKQNLTEIENEAKKLEKGNKDVSQFITESYDKLSGLNELDDYIRSCLRKDTTVTLNGKGNFPFDLNSSILNRFLVSRLYKIDDSFNYLPGNINSVKKESGLYLVERDIKDQVNNQFSDVIIRHGARSELEKSFKEIYDSSKSRFKDYSLLDITRDKIFQNDFFQIEDLKNKKKTIKSDCCKYEENISKITYPSRIGGFYSSRQNNMFFNKSVNIEDEKKSIQQEINELILLWKENREEYPGWFICPQEYRDNLWIYTEHWIFYIVNSIKYLSAIESLSILYELNWRMEKILIPLIPNAYNDILKKIEDLLEKIDPFLINEENENIISPNKSEFKNLDWEEIKEQWIFLHFSLMRLHTEFSIDAKFNFTEEMENIIFKNNNWENRYFYEKTLCFSLRHNKEKALEILNKWEINIDNTYWKIKKAYIYFNIGEIDKAQEIAKNTFEFINSNTNSNSEKSNSEKAWLIILLKQIDRQKNVSFWISDKEVSTSSFEYDHKDTLEILKNSYLNPWKELEKIENKIKEIVKEDFNNFELRSTFDPGKRTYTNKLGNNFFSKNLIPAFQYIRFNEEFSGFFIDEKNMMPIISNQIKEISYDLDLLYKYFFINKFDESIKRLDILNLKDENIDNFYLVFLNILESSYESINKNLEQINYRENYYRSIFIKSLELLSIISFRLNKNNLSKLLDLAIIFYKNKNISTHLYIYDSINKFFDRVLLALPDYSKAEKFHEILSLPISGYKDFKTENALLESIGLDEISDNSDRLIEPVQRIHIINVNKVSKHINKNLLKSSIYYLINVLKSTNLESRSRAIIRLMFIDEIYNLTDEEKKFFAMALYSQVTENDKLPIRNYYIRNFAFLSLPEVNNGYVKEILKKYLLANEIPLLFVESKENNSVKSSIGVGGSFSSNYITELIGSSTPLFTIDNNNYLISWSIEEVNIILEKIITWWDKQKKFFIDKKYESFDHFQNHETLDNIFKLIAEVIFPKLDKSTKTINKKLYNLLLDFESNNISINKISCITIVISKKSKEDIFSNLESGLSSKNRKILEDSILGIYYWIIYFNLGFILINPSNLIDELINSLYYIKEISLERSLDVMSGIVKRYSKSLNTKQIKKLTKAIFFIIDETSFDRYEKNENYNFSIKNEEFLTEYRRLLSSLAFELYNNFNNNKIFAEDLEKIKSILEKDRLPEVRNFWI